MSRRRKRMVDVGPNPDAHDMGSPRYEEVPTRRVYSVEVDGDGWVLTVADVPRDVVEEYAVVRTAADLRELTLANMLRHMDRRDMGLE